MPRKAFVVGAAGTAGQGLGGPLLAPPGRTLDVQHPRHAQLRPAVPVVDDKHALGVNVSREHQLILGDDPLLQVRRVAGQSVEGSRLHEEALPFNNCGRRGLRLPLLEEAGRGAGALGMHAAESNEQAHPFLGGANLGVPITVPGPNAQSQGPLCREPLDWAPGGSPPNAAAPWRMQRPCAWLRKNAQKG